MQPNISQARYDQRMVRRAAEAHGLDFMMVGTGALGSLPALQAVGAPVGGRRVRIWRAGPRAFGARSLVHAGPWSGAGEFLTSGEGFFDNAGFERMREDAARQPAAEGAGAAGTQAGAAQGQQRRAGRRVYIQSYAGTDEPGCSEGSVKVYGMDGACIGRGTFENENIALKNCGGSHEGAFKGGVLSWTDPADQWTSVVTEAPAKRAGCRYICANPKGADVYAHCSCEPAASGTCASSLASPTAARLESVRAPPASFSQGLGVHGSLLQQ